MIIELSLLLKKKMSNNDNKVEESNMGSELGPITGQPEKKCPPAPIKKRRGAEMYYKGKFDSNTVCRQLFGGGSLLPEKPDTPKDGGMKLVYIM